MNRRSQMQGGKNWFLPKEINANRFFWDSHWLETCKTTYFPLWDRIEGAWLRTQNLDSWKGGIGTKTPFDFWQFKLKRPNSKMTYKLTCFLRYVSDPTEVVVVQAERDEVSAELDVALQVVRARLHRWQVPAQRPLRVQPGVTPAHQRCDQLRKKGTLSQYWCLISLSAASIFDGGLAWPKKHIDSNPKCRLFLKIEQ